MPDMVMTLVSILVAGALYVWVGVTLSAVFRQLGGAPWKAWLPLVSQVEMLRLAKRPGWHVVVLAVPICGLVIYYRVLRELTSLLGRPARLALIGTALLPIWAGAVTGAGAKDGTAPGKATSGPLGVDALFDLAPRPPADSRAPADSAPQPPSATPVRAASPAGAASGHGVPEVPVMQAAAAATVYPEPVGPLAGAPVAPAQPGSQAWPMAPAAPVGVPVQPDAAVPQVGTVVPQGGRPVPALEFPQIVQASPWSTPDVVAPPSMPAAPQPMPLPQPAAPAGPVVMAGPVGAARSVAQPMIVPSPVPTVAGTTPPGVSSAFEPSPAGIEASDHTVVIDRASARSWSLVLEDGRSFDLWASSVVVGREPTATDVGVQMLAIPDSTRTISKMHARFDLVDGVWRVSDLGSTNGLVVTGTDGRTFSVRSGAPSVVGTQLVLGSVAMRLVPRGSSKRSA